MSTELVDLWPADIETDVLSPVAIMKFQASQLESKTKGILRANVDVGREDEQTVLKFNVEAPSANGISSELFNVTYSESRCYPCCVRGPEMETSFSSPLGDLYTEDYEDAAGQSDLMEKIRRILNSDEVRSTLDSFIALSNEASSS